FLHADFSNTFASYSKEFAPTLEEQSRFDAIWRKVREDFAKERIPFVVLEEGCPQFPKQNGKEKVHFLYVAGNLSALGQKRVVFLGTSMPSLQGKADTLEAVTEAVRENCTILAPFDLGLGAYALSCALKEGGKAVAFLSSGISKCPSEGLLELMEQVYKKGLLVTQFSPAVKAEKWHVVLRNRFLGSFAEAAFLGEEKDGGPSWPIFDGVATANRPTMIPLSLGSNANFSWCGERLEKGSLPYTKARDIRKLFPSTSSSAPRKEKAVDLTPDLFL
ncbi:MAG: DNA-processing protein DprA, partial [Spirochaetales bacterium]|nr:DNA-processing protein DprA [Candidatus Physcosoma equi]